jgi:hypothetical protein
VRVAQLHQPKVHQPQGAVSLLQTLHGGLVVVHRRKGNKDRPVAMESPLLHLTFEHRLPQVQRWRRSLKRNTSCLSCSAVAVSSWACAAISSTWAVMSSVLADTCSVAAL